MLVYCGRLVDNRGVTEPSVVPWTNPTQRRDLVHHRESSGSAHLTHSTSIVKLRWTRQIVKDGFLYNPGSLMETVMRKFTWKTSFFHLDDIIIYKKEGRNAPGTTHRSDALAKVRMAENQT
ncbi:hypothetical protein T02_10750 [Trichinella nativa]|uniref:Uncharacterized protein n=1 Tax=Trichinella nativa TaxID=6335 RepID=A0A0V1LUS3_9BILA|nr:hypothetical protein T02_10750 [Trichinella nativa]